MRRLLLSLGGFHKDMNVHGRLPGCQSTNHRECYGQLWVCSVCGKTICYAEGTDNDPELCDDCWAQAHAPAFWLNPERGKQMETTLHMQHLIECLTIKHQVDIFVPGAQLLLALPGLPDRLLIKGLSDQRMSVTHCRADADECLACDTDMVFLITRLGWQPVEFVHSDTVWQAYTEWCKATNSMPIDDEESSVHLVNFAEYWAQQLHAQGWLSHGYQPTATLTKARQTDRPTLQQMAEQLFARHGINFGSFAAYLWLDLPGAEKTLLITKRDGYLIHLAYCRTEEEDYLIPQMAVDCVLTVTGTWHPIKIEYEPSIMDQDPQGTEALTEWLARQLVREAWLAHSYLVFGDWRKC